MMSDAQPPQPCNAQEKPLCNSLMTTSITSSRRAHKGTSINMYVIKQAGCQVIRTRTDAAGTAQYCGAVYSITDSLLRVPELLKRALSRQAGWTLTCQTHSSSLQLLAHPLLRDLCPACTRALSRESEQPSHTSCLQSLCRSCHTSTEEGMCVPDMKPGKLLVKGMGTSIGSRSFLREMQLRGQALHAVRASLSRGMHYYTLSCDIL